MTSPDGITWTARTAAEADNWFDVTYGNGLFVAVSDTGRHHHVMTSPDGITWTGADGPSEELARRHLRQRPIRRGGPDGDIMTSPDGITWTERTNAGASWNSVTYGGGRSSR